MRVSSKTLQLDRMVAVTTLSAKPDLNGPELPLAILSDAVVQLPKSSHSELISAESSEIATTVGLIVPDK